MSQVQINRSTVSGYVPNTLISGAMFYNSADNTLYIGDHLGLPVLVSTDPTAIQTQIDAVNATNTAQSDQIALLEAGSQSTTVSATQPSSPESGDLWFDTVSGQLKIYTTEWVIANQVDVTTEGVAGVYPITTDEFFNHIVFTPETNSDGSMSDDELSAIQYISTATRWAEQYTGRFFIVRTVTHCFDCFPDNTGSTKQPLTLMGGTASAILGITYADSNYATQTLSATAYRKIDKHSKTHIYPAMGQHWPADCAAGEPDVINITYTVGTLPAEVPAPIKSAILLIAASLYENRENDIVGTNIKSLKPVIAAKDLLHPFKLR